jgi:hypothetical protein
MGSDDVNSQESMGSRTTFVEVGEALVHTAYRGPLLPDTPYRCSHPLP